MTTASEALAVRALPLSSNATAPDGTEIRLLPRNPTVSMAHGTLPPNRVSTAIRHKTVDEIWFVLDGSAEIWRRLGDVESIVRVEIGNSLTIPVGTCFQFRTRGDEPFRFIMCTTPPWTGDEEAEQVEGFWQGDHATHDAE